MPKDVTSWKSDTSDRKFQHSSHGTYKDDADHPVASIILGGQLSDPAHGAQLRPVVTGGARRSQGHHEGHRGHAGQTGAAPGTGSPTEANFRYVDRST